MNQTTIQCPKCRKVITVQYPSYRGHILTEEALAIDRAIKAHQCKP